MLVQFNPSEEAGTVVRSVTVLVVEDEVLVRLCTADTLRSAGYTVLEAASADEAKALLAAFPDIALIFSDVQMPGATDGVELARFARAKYPAARVMLTSGAVAPPPVDAGVTFVAKPYAPEEIVTHVQDVLK